jgi:hypothetical protein
MATERIASAPSYGATRSSRSVPAPDVVVVEPATARPPAGQGDAHRRVEGEAGGPRLPLAEVSSMRTRARQEKRDPDASPHRWTKRFRPGGRLRILPNRVHLRRGYRLRGHISR